ncbi:MAG: hydantoinase/oxoprolinase family protein [Thiotrichales bacterium]
MQWLGIDTGGTFTDFVHWDDRELRLHKVLSTPEAPERAILQGIDELGIDLNRDLVVIHGSTVATNAVLEGKGVRTAYITNRGFADVLTIGRQTRPELYALQTQPRRPPVPKELCWETGGRIAADARVLEPLTESDLGALRALVARHHPQAVAINLLFSYLDDSHERRIEAALSEAVFVARSSAVLNEQREYERGIATWLNAYVGPLMQGYLQRLATTLAPARVSVMQSHGGTIDAPQAGAHAVELLLSGPAGGLVGARHQARRSGYARLLSFDMGGTSTDVALIDGDLQLASDGEIAGYPIAAPMVDLHTIGAGGGSIAWLDAGGMLQVGPASAGADPGPACYGRGGTEATVTDANVVLGRIPPEIRLGDALPLDIAAARTAIGRLATRMELSSEQTAAGIIRITNEHMAQALRVISVQRGHDPREFVLMPFGGAGGLHMCAVAEALGMTRILVPPHAGVLSAFGMLVAPVARQRSRTRLGLLSGFDHTHLHADLEALAESARQELEQEHHHGTWHSAYSVDLRYAGQSYTLNLPWRDDLVALANDFHSAHDHQYGHALDLPVELVNLRLRMSSDAYRPEIRQAPTATDSAGTPLKAGVDGAYARADLRPGTALEGPACIVDATATLWIAAGWRARSDAHGALLLQRLTEATNHRKARGRPFDRGL